MTSGLGSFRAAGRSASQFVWVLALVGVLSRSAAALEGMPLPEHPRPDAMRPDWQNLNGVWKFRFDSADVGQSDKWYENVASFDKEIVVPFPWGSPLSCVANEADVAWYGRGITVPKEWAGRRVFLVVGACDWHTTAWLDGQDLGAHRGGYTPFELELTSHVKFGQEQQLVLRVDDGPRPFKLEGKQGYGAARGIWQTPYLEARGISWLDTLHFAPDIDAQKVTVRGVLNPAAAEPLELRLEFKTGSLPMPQVRHEIPQDTKQFQLDVPIPSPRLWTPDDPFLYEVDATLAAPTRPADQVSTYFGMRKISVVNLPGTNHRYIALNNQPFYLQMTLDQAYHPEGYYTFPSDAFMRDEILRSRKIGLNGMRIHVKVGIPRKLYWADRLGMLIMADVPNSWGEPTDDMRREAETALRGMLRRDYNHPSIFSWVLFNETWGLISKGNEYTPETQQWVASMYQLARELDSTRLVEDNSACRFDHVVTDINSWHAYVPGYKWNDMLADYARQTHPGSTWNFAEGYQQKDQPQLNSECGNVWGYEGSTGDVDWSWDYHRMLNAFRRHPATCGWLYTEHHDVINEWNGYYRYDRSEKFTGLEELVGGMSVSDLHAPYYLSAAGELCREVQPGAHVQVPLWASVMCDFGRPSKKAVLRTLLYGWDTLGRKRTWNQSQRTVTLKPWMSEEIPALELRMPDVEGLAVLAFWLEDAAGVIVHRNFTTFLLARRQSEEGSRDGTDDPNLRLVRVAPQEFVDAQWSLKQWNVLDGLKVNGAGSGYFAYRLAWPDDLSPDRVEDAMFMAELSAKQLFGKDREGAAQIEGDYMRGQGTADPSQNPNAYPMTDTVMYPSQVRIRVGDQIAGVYPLPDDPADHRGILSWHAQPRDGRLREAGSYGYLIRASIPPAVVRQAARDKHLIVRLEVDEALPGGLAIYGKRFGRYPLDPTLVIRLKDSQSP